MAFLVVSIRLLAILRGLEEYCLVAIGLFMSFSLVMVIFVFSTSRVVVAFSSIVGVSEIGVISIVVVGAARIMVVRTESSLCVDFIFFFFS